MKNRYIGLCGVLWLGLLAGCIYLPQDTPSQDDPCDKARRCDAGGGEVCGVNGRTYGCGELATCLNVAVDDTGRACRPMMMCEPLVACNEFCSGGFAKDANGCDVCKCACDEIPKPECEFNESRVCVDNDNDDCDDVCVCVNDDTSCADLAPAFCPGDPIATCFDTDADGCDDDCTCSTDCPAVMRIPCSTGKDFSCASIDENGCESDCMCYDLPEQCISDLECELGQVCDPNDSNSDLRGCVELETCAMFDVTCGEPFDMGFCEQPVREDCCEVGFCDGSLEECPFLCFYDFP